MQPSIKSNLAFSLRASVGKPVTAILRTFPRMVFKGTLKSFDQAGNIVIAHPVEYEADATGALIEKSRSEEGNSILIRGDSLLSLSLA